MASLYAPAPPLAQAAEGRASRNQGSRCWNCARLGRPPGRSPGAKQAAHSAQAAGSSAQGGWSGGGQRVPLANWRQHCGSEEGAEKAW